jgi:hypothetical protein
LVTGFLQSDDLLGTIDRTNPTTNAEVPIDHYFLAGITLTQAHDLHGTHIHAGFTKIAFIFADKWFKIGFSSSTFISQILYRLQRTAATRAAVSDKG